jgi:plasmid stabilization system protein ParE
LAAPSVRLHPEAIAEAKAAYEWYAERNPAAAKAFISELDDAISQIHTSPERWPMHLHDEEISPSAVSLQRNLPNYSKRNSGHHSRPRTPPSGVLEKPRILDQVSPYQGLSVKLVLDQI